MSVPSPALLDLAMAWGAPKRVHGEEYWAVHERRQVNRSQCFFALCLEQFGATWNSVIKSILEVINAAKYGSWYSQIGWMERLGPARDCQCRVPHR